MDRNFHSQTAAGGQNISDGGITTFRIISITLLVIIFASTIISIYICIALCPGRCKKSTQSNSSTQTRTRARARSRFSWRQQRRRQEATNRSFDGLDQLTSSTSISNIYVTSGSSNSAYNPHSQPAGVTLDLDRSTIYSTIEEVDQDGGFQERRSTDNIWHTHYVYENFPGYETSAAVHAPPYPGRANPQQPLNAAELMMEERRNRRGRPPPVLESRALQHLSVPITSSPPPMYSLNQFVR